jgi:hypothetical protein
MILLSLLRSGPAVQGSGRSIARQWRCKELINLSRRAMHQAHHDTQIQNIRNIGIIAHVDAVSTMYQMLYFYIILTLSEGQNYHH